VRESVGGLWLFGSSERSASYSATRYDEKHYFVVPYRLAEIGYTLYSMRCLPDDAPPVNDLPKRRIFHLPHPHAKATVEELLVTEARQEFGDRQADATGLGNRLVTLADQIDRLDDKAFYGLLVVGGLAALVNPLAGAAIAAKALLPSAGMLLSKFGLKYAGETLNRRQVERQIRAAEEQVLEQFRGADTQSLVNPALAHLDRALNSTGAEFDPLVEMTFEDFDLGDEDRTRLLDLTYRAITNVYEQVLQDRKQWEAARLGAEDIRFLEYLKVAAESRQSAQR
jgi:hypothetical protein